MARDERRVTVYSEGPHSDRIFAELQTLGGPPVVLECWSKTAREREATITEINEAVTDALLTAAWRNSGTPRALGQRTEQQVIESVIAGVAQDLAQPPAPKAKAKGTPKKGAPKTPGKDRSPKTAEGRQGLRVVPGESTWHGLTLDDFMEF